MPISAIDAAQADQQADELRPRARSAGSSTSPSSATISGALAIRIAVSDDDTCCSPKAISGNGIAISVRPHR